MENVFVADFETTVYKAQKLTQVWLYGICPVKEDVKESECIIGYCIEDFFETVFKLTTKNITLYFHNLKFDGSFILNYLLSTKKFKHGIKENYTDEVKEEFFKLDRYLCNNEFTYLISDKGLFYNITIKQKGRFIRIYDSAKLYPTSVASLGELYGNGSEKLEMDYNKIRWPCCKVEPKEIDYQKRDVFIMAKAMYEFLSKGYNKMTIGSNAMQEFKKSDYFLIDYKINNSKERNRIFNEKFPRQDKVFFKEFNCSVYDFVLKSYKGAWCYVNKHKKGKEINHKGIRLDVNSLYPYVMTSESGNYYPIGNPMYFIGNELEKIPEDNYYFVRFKCSFELKEGFLPTVQIKGNYLYNPREFLETSFPKHKGKVVNKLYKDGEEIKDINIVELTMTKTDFILFKEHYEIKNLEILGGVYYKTEIGIFDSYIGKFRKEKENNTGIKRLIAKYFMNNLYGKFATSKNSSFKIAGLKEGALSFRTVVENNKEPGYIPIGSCITSYARNYIIRMAQKLYKKDENGFCYCDTDSLHCDITYEELVCNYDIPIHETMFGAFKCEAEWIKAIFLRAKTYVEVEVEKNSKGYMIEKINITCAGMGKKAKAYLKQILRNKRVSFEILNRSIQVPGNLKYKQIRGGMLLEDKNFKIRS